MQALPPRGRTGTSTGRKAKGREWGRARSRFPAARAPGAASPLRDDLPSAGCRTHMVNGAEGQANGWAGLAGGG